MVKYVILTGYFRECCRKWCFGHGEILIFILKFVDESLGMLDDRADLAEENCYLMVFQHPIPLNVKTNAKSNWKYEGYEK